MQADAKVGLAALTTALLHAGVSSDVADAALSAYCGTHGIPLVTVKQEAQSLQAQIAAAEHAIELLAAVEDDILASDDANGEAEDLEDFEPERRDPLFNQLEWDGLGSSKDPFAAVEGVDDTSADAVVVDESMSEPARPPPVDKVRPSSVSIATPHGIRQRVPNRSPYADSRSRSPRRFPTSQLVLASPSPSNRSWLNQPAPALRPEASAVKPASTQQPPAIAAPPNKDNQPPAPAVQPPAIVAPSATLPQPLASAVRHQPSASAAKEAPAQQPLASAVQPPAKHQPPAPPAKVAFTSTASRVFAHLLMVIF